MAVVVASFVNQAIAMDDRKFGVEDIKFTEKDSKYIDPMVWNNKQLADWSNCSDDDKANIRVAAQQKDREIEHLNTLATNAAQIMSVEEVSCPSRREQGYLSISPEDAKAWKEQAFKHRAEILHARTCANYKLETELLEKEIELVDRLIKESCYVPIPNDESDCAIKYKGLQSQKELLQTELSSFQKEENLSAISQSFMPKRDFKIFKNYKFEEFKKYQVARKKEAETARIKEIFKKYRDDTTKE